MAPGPHAGGCAGSISPYPAEQADDTKLGAAVADVEQRAGQPELWRALRAAPGLGSLAVDSSDGAGPAAGGAASFGTVTLLRPLPRLEI